MQHARAHAHNRLLPTIACICLGLSASACGDDAKGGATDGYAAGPPTGEGSTAAGSGSTNGGSGGAGNGGTGADFGDDSEAPLPPEGPSDVGGGVAEPPSGNGGEGHAAGQLTAAEWHDLSHWDFFRNLFEGEQGGEWAAMESYWGYYTRGRIPVTVSHQGAPVVDATVELTDANSKVLWQARSDVNGFAELYAGMFDEAEGPFTITARDAGQETKTELATLPDPSARLTLELAGTNPAKLSLDLMLMVDTTGSMGDELAYLQGELADVIRRVQSEVNQQLSLRLSVNFYRDQNDAYVVRPFAFSTNVETQLKSLSAQSAAGGGDIPEAVDQALENAILEHSWSTEATARILFLVLDAPPHHDAQGMLESLHDLTFEAAKRGIQIVPVGASGIDKPTEFLLRYLAVSTNGTYTFLTDDSGIGNGHLDPGTSIGAHEVELLNDLLVRVVSERLTAASAQ